MTAEPEFSNPYAPPQVPDVAVEATAFGPELQDVARGLRLIYTALNLSLASMIALACLGFFGTTRGLGGAMPIVGISFLPGSVIVVLSLWGTWRCVSVPVESTARPFAVVSLVLHIGFLSLGIVGLAIAGMAWVAGLLIEGLSILMFVEFLRRTAQHIQRPDVARRAGRVLIGLFVVAALGIWSVFYGRQPGVQTTVFVLTGFGLGLTSLMVFLMYANLVNAVSKTILRPDVDFGRGHLG